MPAEALTEALSRISALEDQVAALATPARIDSELWSGSNVTITDGSSGKWRALRRMTLADIQAGDEYDISAQYALRNDTGWNVELGVAIVFVTDSTPPGEATGAHPNTAYPGTLVGTTNGSNITPGNHYGQPLKCERWVAPSDVPSAGWLLMLVRARCSAADGSQILTQLVDQQSFTARRFRAPA